MQYGLIYRLLLATQRRGEEWKHGSLPPCLPRWLDSSGIQRSKAGSKTSAVMSPETVLLGIAIPLSNYGGYHRILAELHQRRRYRKIVKKPRHNDDAPKRPTGGTVHQIRLRPRISNPRMPIEHLIFWVS